MALDDVLHRIMRWPWRVAPPGTTPSHPYDREVLTYLLNHPALTDVFREPPPDAWLQSIALPTIVFLDRCIIPVVNQDNPWRHVIRKQETRDKILKIYQFDREQDRYITTLMHNEVHARKFLAYMAATFAFTAWMYPIIMPLNDVAAVFNDRDYADSLVYHQLMTCGLLILTDFTMSQPNTIRQSGPMSPMLSRRVDNGRVNLFFDMAGGKVCEKVLAGQIPEVKMVEKWLEKKDIGKEMSFVERYLAGPCTYQLFLRKFAE